jgi:hypothetical protein
MENDTLKSLQGNDPRFQNTSELSEKDRPFKRRGIDSRFKSRDRWELERERFQLWDDNPPTIMRDPDKLDSKVDAALKMLKVEYNVVQDGVASNWNNIARADYAAHSKPGEFIEASASLVIYVENTLWLAQIRRLAQRNLLQRIQAVYPQVKKLIFKLNPKVK